MDRFVEQYTEFCREIAGVLPKDVAGIQATREALKEGDGARVVLERFMGWVRPRIVALSAKDVGAIWGAGQQILPGVEIGGRWERFSEGTRASLWRWVQVLYLSGTAAVGDDAATAADFLDGLADTMGGLDEETLAEKTREMLEELSRTMEGGGGGGGGGGDMNAPEFNPEEFEKMGKDLLEGTTLGEIADEMIQEILSGQFKFGDVIAAMEAELANERDPAKIVAKLMSSRHKGKLMQLMRKLASRLQEKLKSKNVSQEVLMREAAAVMEKLKNTEVLAKLREMAGGLGGAAGGRAAGGGGRRVNKKKARKMRKPN